MPLNIRDERATILARDLANLDGTTMTQAVITALKETLAVRRKSATLRERVRQLTEHAVAKAKSSPQPVTKNDFDEQWEQ